MHNFEVQQASRGRESAGVSIRAAAGARVIVVPVAAAADPGVCFVSCQQAGVRAFGGGDSRQICGVSLQIHCT